MAHRRERCEERRGILLGLIYQRRGEVLSGHSSAADSGPGPGAPWRQTDTAKELRQQKSLPHTNTENAPSHLLSRFGLTLLSSPSSSRRGGRLSRTHRPRVPAAAPVNACISFVFVVFFLFWHLLPCSLCVSMLCPPQ